MPSYGEKWKFIPLCRFIVYYVNYVGLRYCNHYFRDEDDDVQVVKEVEIPECDNQIQEDEISEIAVRYDVVDGQPMLKSDKEKECWALFKKMTAKGVSVTFDTVLRFENIDENKIILKIHYYSLCFVFALLTVVPITIWFLKPETNY